MPISSIASCYVADSAPVIARGILFTAEQVDAMLAGPVKDILLDTTGKQELNAILAGLATTDFSQKEIEHILQNDVYYEDWLVGEAIAEAFVGKTAQCEYPWPTSRDLKNTNASPAGCDLTGFQFTENQENPYRFSFGEVKTSYDENSPPSVMTGLGKQLFGLRDSKDIKADLVRYLALHAQGKDWMHKFQSSVKRYIDSQGADIVILGVLVRDTDVKESDIKGKAVALAGGCPERTDIRLYALYLPANTILTLPEKVQAVIKTGSPV